MNIRVNTTLGEIVVIPSFKLSPATRRLVKRNLKEIVDEVRPIEELQARIKKRISWVDSPRGALVAYLTSRGWTQTELGRRTGIPQGNISQMLKGDRPIGRSTAKKLARAFDIDHRRFL